MSERRIRKSAKTAGGPADEACLLTYLSSTYPSPVQVSTPQTPMQANISAAAFNRGGDPVYCNEVVIAVPVGPNPNELFAAQPQPTASVNTAKWAISSMVIRSGRELGLDPEVDYATFIFDCIDPSDFLINYSLVFSVMGQVSQLTGESTIRIMEQSDTTSDPDNFTNKTCTYTVTADTPQFYLQNFVTTATGSPTVPATEFANGADIDFAWGSNGTFFRLFRKGDPTPIYAGTQTAFTLRGGAKTDTTFFLVAMVSGDPRGDQPQPGYQPIFLYDALTVTVSNPDLTPKTSNIAGTLNVGGAATLASANVNGTLGVTGAATLASANVGGTLGVAGITTLGNAAVGGTLNVTGATILANANVVGKLAVGTADLPQQGLSVAGSLNVDQSNVNNGAAVNPGITFGSHSGEGIASKRTSGGNQNGLDLYTNFAPRLSIANNGRVGIGTNNPTQALLVVNGNAATLPTGNFGYLNNWQPTGIYSGPGSQPAPYSIWATSRVAADEFNAFSDERIKHVEGCSDAAADLRTLLAIEVTDYRHKDVIGKGDAPHKKFIAQQVEQVFPQAVGRTTDAVPDIYRRAPCAEGWVELATDLKAGERVRLISDEAEGVYEVLEADGGRFRTGFAPAGDAVFVYGREVEDFRTLDYDAVAALNVSATQQLKREKDEEVESLRAENDALAERLERLESKLESALNLLAMATDGAGRKP